MRSLLLAIVAVCLPLMASGQTVQGDSSTIRLGARPAGPDITRSTKVKAATAPAAVLRGLDKVSGASVDLQVGNEAAVEFGTLSIVMHECRYPVGNPNGDAFVHVTIQDSRLSEPAFDGWMIASSPALSAMDHPRYDIWVIRCKLDDRTPSVVAGESSPRPLVRPTGLGGN